MNEIQNTPELRFDGFTEPWKEYRLGDLGEVAMCKRIYKDQTSDSGDVPFFKIGTFGGKPDAYISNELFEEYRSKFPFPDAGDVLISAAGTIGRTVVYNGERAYYQDSNIVWLKHGDEINNLFFLQFLKVKDWKNLEGSTLKRLYNKDILETPIALPETAEQNAVGSFFRDIDSLIALQQRKYERLQHLKQALLRKMFPKPGEQVPELRFEGFTEPWKRRKFSSFAYAAGVRNTSGQHYPSYSVSNERGFLPQEEQFENGGTMSTADKTMYWIVEPGSFAYNPARINVGSIGYLESDGKVIVSSLYEVFKTDDTCVDRFLWHWFKSPLFMIQIKQYQEGGVRLYFFFDKLLKSEICMPSTEEQAYLGTFFDHLDSLIVLYQRKHERLQHLKQALLQRMFV